MNEKELQERIDTILETQKTLVSITSDLQNELLIHTESIKTIVESIKSLIGMVEYKKSKDKISYIG